VRPAVGAQYGSGTQRTASDASWASLPSQGSGTIPSQAPAFNSSLDSPKEDNSHNATIYDDRAAVVTSKVAAAASAAAVGASAGSAISASPLWQAPDAEPGNLEVLQKRLRSLNQASLQQQA
jgi:hypothetical protein